MPRSPARFFPPSARAALLVIGFAGSGFAGLGFVGFNVAAAQNAEGDQSVVGVAERTPDFSTLLNALSAAGLTETLQGEGPFTVFAPTNDAFAKLSDDELSALLEDREALERVLSYHVVPGSYTTSDITADMTSFPTLAGSPLPITEAGVGEATVTAVNIAAANGVVFAIDTVLTPPDAAGGAETDDADAQDTGGGLYSSTAEASERFEVNEVGGSGVSGSVLVAEYEGGRAVVTVSLSGTPAGGLHPAALYAGSCDDFSGEAVTALEPVSGASGVSTTVVELPFAAITQGDHALFVNVSEADPSVVACGEVGR